ncbi:MAG TPA: DedA family protein [Candidatus Saccharimonadales bacterium]|nr:DedA family protein [Candidatus Saccharimonadales bacterium]
MIDHLFAFNLSVTHIIQAGGLYLLGAFLFAEVGLFMGFFLPGDTLLIAAGIYAKQGHLNIAAVILVAALAAIAGDHVAYNFGKHVGRRLFERDTFIFRRDHLEIAERFYHKHGPKTLLIAHFLPIVRTFSPVLSGVSHMHYPKFTFFNAVGDSFWAIGVSLIGYYVGSRIPNVDRYILIAIGVAVVGSLVPTIFQLVRMQLRRRAKAKSE